MTNFNLKKSQIKKFVVYTGGVRHEK